MTHIIDASPVDVETGFGQLDALGRLKDDCSGPGVAKLEEEGRLVIADRHDDVVVRTRHDRRHPVSVRLDGVHQSKP